MRGLLIVLLAAAWAQAAALPEPIFPADNETPEKGRAAELLEAVCPGKVISGKEIGCGDACPEFTGFRGYREDWHVASVIHGHFLSATSDDAALAVLGCESHALNFRGTVLLTRHSKKWGMVWYKAGIDTGECHKRLLADSREILVCMGWYGAQGYTSTALFVQDLLSPTDNLGGAFFRVVDDTFTCGSKIDDDAKPNPLTLQYIERVTFGVHRRDTTVLSVIAHYGTRPMTPADVKQCEQERDSSPSGLTSFKPATRRREIDLLFDGHDYHVAPWSPKVEEVAAGH